MSAPAVVFDSVWKKFQRGERHDSLRDLVPAMARRIVKRDSPTGLGEREFWATRDVSFTVGEGQALGIIGSNGAGKSTILKLLTKILRPTRGHCHVRGRIGALIEIAAGFHPDLTGRENVYLQGAMMGMRRAEITRKFDEIVEFAGLPDFMDTPVKRYSSGMNARLGFAIAAHLDPDVLIIDEVLAVGDLVFQTRAFQRMEEVVRSGIPVVIVSHQLDRVAHLCTDAILLEHGEVIARGVPNEVLATYVLRGSSTGATADDSPIIVESCRAETPGPVRSGERVRIRIAGTRTRRGDGEHEIGLRVRALNTGEPIFSVGSQVCGATLPEEGPFAMEVELQMNVPPGPYSVEAYGWDMTRGLQMRASPVLTVSVEEGLGFYGTIQLNPVIRTLPQEEGERELAFTREEMLAGSGASRD